MAYITFYSMTDDQRRRAWRLFRSGGLLALTGYGGLALALGLWAEPMGKRPDGWIWRPIDWYGVGCCLLFALGPIGLALFLWAVANYRIDRMVRLQRVGIAKLDGAIRLWSLIFFVGGAVLLGRMVFVAVSATVAGWPTGQARSFYLSNERIVDVAFSPGGDLILATTHKDAVAAWDAYRGKKVAVPAGTPRFLASARARTLLGSKVLRLAAADGQTSVEVDLQFDLDREAVVRDGQGRELRRLRGHEASINGLALTPDGKQALTGSNDKTVRLWDVDSGKELHRLRGHREGVTCVQFIPGGAGAFSGDNQGYVRSWDLKAGHELPAFGGQRKHDKVGFLSVSADGRWLLSTGRRAGRTRAENLCLWDTGTGMAVAELEGMYGIDEGQSALSPDGKWALTAGLNMIQQWCLVR